VACLVIDGLIFGAQQVVKGFWFLGLLFCGVGVVCCLCGYCLIFFVGNLRCSGQNSIKNWGVIPPKLLYVLKKNCLQMN